jgi:hypothetical protein
VQVSESKIKFYDAENARRQSHLEEQLNLASGNEATLRDEIARKEALVQNLQKQVEEQLKTANDWALAAEAKQKDNADLEEQLALLKKQMQDLQAEHEMKELSRLEQQNALHKQVLWILIRLNARWKTQSRER